MQADPRITIGNRLFAHPCIPETMAKTPKSIQKLTEEVEADLAAFRAGRPSDGRAGMELMRRAFEQNEPRAWNAVYRIYLPQLTSWVRRHHAFAGLDEEDTDLASQALERARRAFTPARFADLTDLRQVFTTLKMAVNSVVVDHVRARRRHLDLLAADPDPDADWEALVDRAGCRAQSVEELSTARRLWEYVAAQLHDAAERVVVEQTFMLGLPPREIARLNPDLFADAAEVHSVKEKVLKRLRRAVSGDKPKRAGSRPSTPHP